MWLDAIRRRYEGALEWLTVILMAALAIEVTIGVIFRTAGYSLVWYDEFAAILLAWLTFYGSALASVKRAHIGCPEVMAMLPPKIKFAFRLLAEVLTIGFFLLMGWMGYQVLGVLDTDYLITMPSIPVSWVQSVVPISAVLIVAAELITLPKVLTNSLACPAITGGASH
ncbi:MAG: TRAP transporter small permease [Burkholderiales bacterium]|nr:TRAP transporter small permease [Burkholderiales bacterium]